MEEIEPQQCTIVDAVVDPDSLRGFCREKRIVLESPVASLLRSGTAGPGWHVGARVVVSRFTVPKEWEVSDWSSLRCRIGGERVSPPTLSALQALQLIAVLPRPAVFTKGVVLYTGPIVSGDSELCLLSYVWDGDAVGGNPHVSLMRITEVLSGLRDSTLTLLVAHEIETDRAAAPEEDAMAAAAD